MFRKCVIFINWSILKLACVADKLNYCYFFPPVMKKYLLQHSFG